MALTWNKKYRLINSQGDIKTNVFDSEVDAQTWITANGEAGHEYYIVPFYTN